MSKSTIVLWGVAAVAVGSAVFMYLQEPAEPPLPLAEDAQSVVPVLSRDTIVVDGSAYEIEVATSSSDRKRGLSGRQSLGDVDGLLFVFPEAGEFGIWMKDMHFAIDVIWLDAEGVVINVEENLRPEDFPTIYYPDRPAYFAIETNPGFAAEEGIVAGSVVELPQVYRLEL